MRFSLIIIMASLFMLSITTGIFASPPHPTKPTPVHHNCLAGYHWEPKGAQCLPNCENGYRWDAKAGKCFPVIKKGNSK